MTKQLWLNLPVKDVGKSKEFFTQLGFELNPRHRSSDSSASLLIGGIVVMLFGEASFKGFTGSTIADTRQGTEVLISVDAESKEEVDELAGKAVAAGGHTNHKPYEMQGYMYGCVFSDLDGHKWNVLYMDMSKMQT